ncbi:MAG TPA: TetR/AcrR family transcriptional regulator [Streptosporangiaceae bacterium]|jgi:AcrR family transcriptional regulator|nr:TetR/AcrR family transcriptional regulator [Streptosporangiaceae bacterium]
MNDIAEATVASGLPPRADTAPAEGTGGSGTPHSDARSRTDTRARIQHIAVELFTEHGYEGTSLREIAEHLGVTKAALYYHFKSKEDIILSLVEDYKAQMDALIGWAKERPGNADTRREILDRYMHIVAQRSQVFRMMHQNQAALNTMASALRTLKNAPLQLADQLAGPDASLRERARAMMALGSMSVGWMFLADQVTDRDELSQIVSAIAAELVDPLPEYDS